MSDVVEELDQALGFKFGADDHTTYTSPEIPRSSHVHGFGDQTKRPRGVSLDRSRLAMSDCSRYDIDRGGGFNDPSPGSRKLNWRTSAGTQPYRGTNHSQGGYELDGHPEGDIDFERAPPSSQSPNWQSQPKHFGGGGTGPGYDLPLTQAPQAPCGGPERFRFNPVHWMPATPGNGSGLISSFSPIEAKRSTVRRSQQSVSAPKNATMKAFCDSQLEKTGSAQQREGRPYELEEVAVKPKDLIPTVHGIQLVPVDRLSDRHRSVFLFPLFNAVQSKCFNLVYESTDNIVVAAPTGAGKTAIMELAICALSRDFKHSTYKVVYQAPTKALCAERKRDWEKKFCHLGLVITELTGDTDQVQLSSVRKGDVIVTTPEKWDSMTRGWGDHRRLLDMVRLFLIDEVHVLKETRGATLEAVVSRMKSIGSDVRFVALSATVPNSNDICTWLGRNSQSPEEPAHRETFGPEFRPVQLVKHVYGFNYPGNDFQFDKVLDKSLPELVQKHSAGKPAMVFCMTRAICVSTAKLLSGKWQGWNDNQRPWRAPKKKFSFADRDLQSVAESGVAFHHAGINAADRTLVETMYLDGELSVICCTSTLAVGVNLPAHLVVIKNTVCWSENGVKEYVDLEIMQMLGRAGRPQFDDTGVAVILTAKDKKDRYERMREGSEILESSLHLNLVEHMNAEVGLGTVTDMGTARQWLKSTFLNVRLKKNPHFYKLEGQTQAKNSEQCLDDICERGIRNLVDEGMMVDNGGKLTLTKFGDAMARYYIKMGTMQSILRMPPKASLLDVAEEFKEVRLRAGEKGLYKELNKDLGIKFPIKEDISSAAHKVAILIQFELGLLEFPGDQNFQRMKTNLTQDKNMVFKHCVRVLRCLVDCQEERRDAATVLSALRLARCIQGRVWEKTASELRQLSGIGVGMVRRFVNANVRSIQTLATLEPHQIETILARNPPYGTKLLEQVKRIPKLKVSAQLVGMQKTSKGDPPIIEIMADIGLDTPDAVRSGRTRAPDIPVVFLAERSDGFLVKVDRVFAQSLADGKTIRFSVPLESPDQFLRCHVACEQLAGTWKSSELKFNIAPPLFPTKLRSVEELKPASSAADPILLSDDEYGDADIFDDLDIDIENYANQRRRISTQHEQDAMNTATADYSQVEQESVETETTAPEPVQLPNGNWECRHKCTDKTKCKHMCCREGLDKPPKIQKRKHSALQREDESAELKPEPNQTKPENTDSGKPKATLKASGKHPFKTSSLEQLLRKGKIGVVDLTDEKPLDDLEKLRRLHENNTMPKEEPDFLHSTRSSYSIPSFTAANGPRHIMNGTDSDDEPPQEHIQKKKRSVHHPEFIVGEKPSAFSEKLLVKESWLDPGGESDDELEFGIGGLLPPDGFPIKKTPIGLTSDQESTSEKILSKQEKGNKPGKKRFWSNLGEDDSQDFWGKEHEGLGIIAATEQVYTDTAPLAKRVHRSASPDKAVEEREQLDDSEDISRLLDFLGDCVEVV